MTKAQLINALIDVEDWDVQHLITRLMDYIEEVDPQGYQSSDLIAAADDTLKSLEDDQPVYFDCPKSEVNFLAEVNAIVPGYKVPHSTGVHADSIILTA